MKLAQIANTVFDQERLVAMQINYKLKHFGEVAGVTLYFDTKQEIFVPDESGAQSVQDYVAAATCSLGIMQTTSSIGK